MGLILCAVVALVPLIILPGALFYFDVTPKVLVLLAGTAVLVPWFALRGTQGLRQLFGSRCGRWFGWLLMAQTVSLLLATVFSTNPMLSHTGTNWRRFGTIPQIALLLFALIAAACIAGRPRLLHPLLATIAAAGTLAATYGIAQYFGWDPWIPARTYHVGEGAWTIVRPPGTLGYVSYFATYLDYVVFAGCALALGARSKWQRVLGLAAGGLGSAAIVLSGTRAAVLGLVVGIVFLALSRRVAWRRAAVFLAPMLACGVVFYYSPAGQMLRSRSRWVIEDPLGGARLLLWRDALTMATSHWLTGTGVETFSSEFPRYQSRDLARAFPDYYHESPHNIFLDAFTSQGVFGLAVLALLCALPFFAPFTRNRDASSAPLCAGFLAGLVSQQFTSFTIPTALYFYLTAAVLVALGQPAAAIRKSRPVLAALLTPVSVFFCLFALRLGAADRDLLRVQHALDNGRIQQAADLYGDVRHWQPHGMSADLWYSRAMASAARKAPLALAVPAWREGLEAAIRAAGSAEDRQNAWYNLAAFYAAQNDADNTEAALRSAIRIAPSWFKPHWALAQVLRARGRIGEAASEAARGQDLDGGKHPEVSRTLAEIRAQSGRQQ